MRKNKGPQYQEIIITKSLLNFIVTKDSSSTVLLRTCVHQHMIQFKKKSSSRHLQSADVTAQCVSQINRSYYKERDILYSEIYRKAL